jgi:hypothetical protein
MFYHLIHVGERSEDYLNKFMMIVDTRVAKIFEEFDRCVLGGRPIEVRDNKYLIVIIYLL